MAELTLRRCDAASLSKIDRYAAARHETRRGLLSRAALSLIQAEAKGGGAR